MNNNNNKKGRRPNKLRRQKRFGTTIPNQLYSTTFPREMKVTMVYFELQNFTGTTGVANDRVYSLNNLFDPNTTGVGHQPQGYDQWETFYNRYRVDATEAHMEFPNADSVYGTHITIVGNNSSTAFNDPSVAAESPLAVNKSHSGSGPSTVLNKRFNLADLNGVTREVYRTDDRYQSQFGAGPSEGLYLHIVTCDLNLAPTTMSYTVLIRYEVTMFDPKQMPLS